MTTALVMLCYVAIVGGLGYVISWLMVPFFGRGWRLFVAPGIFLHELAHAAACVLVGARVHEINFWKSSGGHVIHGSPRVHLIGPVLISFAPTIFMTIVLVAIAPLIAPNVTDQPWLQSVPTTIGAAIIGYVRAIAALAIELPWLELWPLLAIYGMLNVAVTIAPSKRDLLNARWALVAVLILVFGIGQLLNLQVPLDFFWPALALSLVYLGMSFLGVLIVWVVIRLIYKKHPNPWARV